MIVPVRDNDTGVGRVIERLRTQTLPLGRFELVVGDDGSRSGALEALAGDEDWIRVVSGPRRNSYAARNMAAREARGRVLAFCDSDCLPEPGWLASGLSALEHADVVAGAVTFAPPPRPTAWSLLTMDMFLDQRRNTCLGRGVTANLFVRRSLFATHGGFDESVPSGGDYDFVGRCVGAGARLAYGSNAVVLHPTLDDARTFLRKVWNTNLWSAFHYSRARTRASPLAILTFIPFLGVAIARRRALRPIAALDRRRLQEAGVAPGAGELARALGALYLVVAYVAALARARGYVRGKRTRIRPAYGLAGCGGELYETAQRIRQAHVLDRAAVDLEETG